MIRDHGHDAVFVLVQGKLAAGGKIVEAGLVAQVKTAKATAEAA